MCVCVSSSIVELLLCVCATGAVLAQSQHSKFRPILFVFLDQTDITGQR